MATIKFGIDWEKIAVEVNIARQNAIKAGTKSAQAFNTAYQSVMRQHPAITGDAWKQGRALVGTIMAGWKKLKSAKESAETKKKPRKEKKASILATPALPKRIVKVEGSQHHLFLVLDGVYEVIFTPTERGRVSASVRGLDKSPLRHSTVPGNLLKDARAVAENHFFGDKKTSDLF